MNLNALCLSFRSQDCCFVCISFAGWDSTSDRQLGPKMGNDNKYFSQGPSNVLQWLHHRELNKRFATTITYLALYQLSFSPAFMR